MVNSFHSIYLKQSNHANLKIELFTEYFARRSCSYFVHANILFIISFSNRRNCAYECLGEKNEKEFQISQFVSIESKKHAQFTRKIGQISHSRYLRSKFPNVRLLLRE